MKRNAATLCVLTLALTGALTTIPTTARAQTWQQIWSDEFNWNGGIDQNKWQFEVGNGGWGNNELQYYTNNRPENTRVNLFSGSSNGRLIIEARKEPYGGSNYTSARLKSAPSWTYGRMEVRAKLPGGRGTWPAIWMLPQYQSYGTNYWPDSGEIDIMEQVGYDPNVIHGSLHTLWYNFTIGTQRTATLTVSDPTVNWHNYAVEWRPHDIRMFIDGQQYFTANRNGEEWQGWPFDKPFQFRLNVAVGGNWGGAQGVDDAIFPRSMEIDWVRVSKMNSTPYAGLPNLPGRLEAENFDNGGEGFAYHDVDGGNNGGAYRSTGVDLASTTDGYATQYVGWIAADEWLTYSVNLTQNTNYGFTFRLASPYSGKKFYIEVDDQRVTPDITVPNTGGWNNWQTVAVSRYWIPAGQHKIRLVARTDGFNVNWIDVWNAGL